MKKRIFVGIKIDNQLGKEVIRFEQEILTNLHVRFLPKENLHITILPPWSEENVEGIKNILSQVTGVIPFEIKFTKVSFGPNKQHPRLIWALGAAPKELFKLKDLLEERFNKKTLGIDFKLHLTLARFNQKDFKKFPIKLLDEKVYWRQKVSSFVLYESILLPSGSRYKILQEIRL